MGSGDDDSVWTNYNGYIVGRMYRNHDLNQNTTNVKSSVHLGEVRNDGCHGNELIDVLIVLVFIVPNF